MKQSIFLFKVEAVISQSNVKFSRLNWKVGLPLDFCVEICALYAKQETRMNFLLSILMPFEPSFFFSKQSTFKTVTPETKTLVKGRIQ